MLNNKHICECGHKKEQFLMAKVGNKSFKDSLNQKLEEHWFCPKCNAGRLEVTKDGGLKIVPISQEGQEKD